ncbi:MAG: hypothetical protein ABW199_09645 [Caulobacterales bacterium]
MLRGLRRRRSGFGQALAAFALLAIVVRALIPAGYMVSPDAGRFVTVTLCSGMNQVEAVIDRTTGEVQHGDHQQDGKAAGKDTPCVFAAVAPLAAPEAPLAITLSYALLAIGGTERIAVSPGRGLAAPPPYQTGPPATV